MQVDPRIIVGNRLRAARRQHRWTQARLAREAKVARESIYRIEHGRMPFGDTAMRLCDVLGLDRAELNLDRRETDAIHLHPSDTFLRDRRKALGLTLAEVANAAGVSAATLSRFERGSERSRVIANHDSDGRTAELVNEGLVRILKFASLDELTTFWRHGYLPPA